MPYIKRLIDPLCRDLVAEEPAIMLVGPRACGKTTTAKRLTSSALRMDRPEVRQVVNADPDAVIASETEPVLLDEWQFAPDVLGAVKRLVDDDPHPGRFVLTGSVSTEMSPVGWPMAGRVTRLEMWGLTQREIAGAAATTGLIDVLFSGDFTRLTVPPDPPDLMGYCDLALRGMLPELLNKTPRARELRLESYIDQAMNHDLSVVSERRDPRLLRKYLIAVAANTAGAPEHKTILDAVNVVRSTAVAYDGVLESIFLTEQISAWATNRLDRLARTPKRYITDSALLIPLLGIDHHGLKRNADLLGRVIDTFVMSQIRPELSCTINRIDPFHVRTRDGRHEIDILLQARDGRVVAVEVKATAAPQLSDARHLLWLQENIGADFRCGVVFHTGARIFQLAPAIFALPIATLWGKHE